MGFFVRAGLCALVLALVPAAADPGPEKTFEQWVAMAEAGDPGVDFTALRQAYVRSPGYDGYGMGWRDDQMELIKAANVHDCAKLFTIADKIRKADYTYPLLHLMLANCYHGTGDSARGEREHAIFVGLRESLFKSGDGKSIDTAYVVITMAEERFILIMNRLQETGQALLNKNGHNFDRIEAVNSETGEKAEVYFNVDAMFGSLTRKLGDQH